MSSSINPECWEDDHEECEGGGCKCVCHKNSMKQTNSKQFKPADPTPEQIVELLDEQHERRKNHGVK